jgi:hypothetical protein
MYQIIDTCYGQNLGLEEFVADAEMISLTLKMETLLDDWKCRTLPSLELQLCNVPLVAQDLEKTEAKDKSIQRFNLVLSLRFHNLRILLHRPILEKFLDAYRGASHGGFGDLDTSMMRQICISSIENCLDSARIIISIVHTVVMSKGWRRDLLGAWNYSLFYSEYPFGLFDSFHWDVYQILTLKSIQCRPGHNCSSARISKRYRHRI